MLGPSLHFNTSFKKNWKFVWALGVGGAQLSGGLLGAIDNIYASAKNLKDTLKDMASKFDFKTGKISFETSPWEKLTWEKIKSVVFFSYISQLAKSVDLPDDEIELESYKVGIVDYPVPKGRKLGDITVTYLDDSNDSVYNYHKCWLELINPRESVGNRFTFSMRPFSDKKDSYCMCATYAAYENDLGMFDYFMLKDVGGGLSQAAGAISNAVNSVVGSAATSVMSSVATTAFSMSGLQGLSEDLFLEYKLKQTFPQIYPVQVKRSASDKSGGELSTVTVTYKRIPKVTNCLRTPYNGLSNFAQLYTKSDYP